MREVRLSNLYDLVEHRGAVRVEEASEALGVSRETIRRDLTALAQQGLVKRTRGGATVHGRALAERSIDERELEHGEAKEAIAHLVASSLIEDGMAVMLDAGTTALAVARALAGRQITVVTSSLTVAQVILPTATPVILIGGQIREKSMMTVGLLAEKLCEMIHCDIAFLAGPAINIEHGLMDSYPEGIQVKRAMMNSADSAYLIADSSKFGKTAFLQVCELSEVTGFVTDAGLGTEAIAAYQSLGLETHVASTHEDNRKAKS